jgi:hypothetical protein
VTEDAGQALLPEESNAMSLTVEKCAPPGARIRGAGIDKLSNDESAPGVVPGTARSL